MLKINLDSLASTVLKTINGKQKTRSALYCKRSFDLLVIFLFFRKSVVNQEFSVSKTWVISPLNMGNWLAQNWGDCIDLLHG